MEDGLLFQMYGLECSYEKTKGLRKNNHIKQSKMPHNIKQSRKRKVAFLDVRSASRICATSRPRMRGLSSLIIYAFKLLYFVPPSSDSVFFCMQMLVSI